MVKSGRLTACGDWRCCCACPGSLVLLSDLSDMVLTKCHPLAS